MVKYISNGNLVYSGTTFYQNGQQGLGVVKKVVETVHTLLALKRMRRKYSSRADEATCLALK